MRFGRSRHPRRRAPFSVEHSVDPQGRPPALEPIGLQQTRLTPEAETLEQPLDRPVAVIGVGDDPMHVVDVEERRNEPVSASRVRPLPWLAGASVTPISAVADGSVMTQLAQSPISDPSARSRTASCTQAPGRPNSTIACAARKRSASAIEYSASQS